MLCQRSIHALAHQLKKTIPLDWDKWLHYFASGLLVASVVHIFQVLQLPLELPVNSLTINFANHLRVSDAGDPLNDVAIVHLDLTRFRSDAYQGATPLDRCALAQDLGRLLDNKAIETVAVDFFLAPTYRLTHHEVTCQSRLDQVLDHNPGRVIAIRRENDGDRDQHYKDWFAARSGVAFGHPDLGNEFGMVRNHIVGPSERPAFADLVAERLCRRAMPDEKRKRCDGLHPGAAAHASDRSGELHSYPIVFGNLRHFYRQGEPLKLDDKCLAAAAPACAPIRHVFLGSEFSADDEFLTPIGVRVGVDVHAAIASQPRNHPSHGIGFAIDVLMATLFFAPFIHLMWGKYFEVRVGMAAHRSPERAYLWICLMLLVLGSVLVVLVMASTLIFVVSGAWISPVPMAIGTLIDGLMLGSVNVSTELLAKVRRASHSGVDGRATAVPHATLRAHSLSHSHSHDRPLKAYFQRPRSQWLVAAIPCLTGIFIVGFAVVDLILKEIA